MGIPIWLRGARVKPAVTTHGHRIQPPLAAHGASLPNRAARPQRYHGIALPIGGADRNPIERGNLEVLSRSA
jgi:hypothetical protein